MKRRLSGWLSIAVLTGGLTQEIWVMRQLGFVADPVPTTAASALNNPAGPNPLPVPYRPTDYRQPVPSPEDHP